jgi:cell division protein FtsB
MANTLEIFINGNSKDLEAALSSAEKKLAGFSSKMKDIGQSLSLRLTAPLALAGGAAIKLASDFEESLNKVNVAFKDSSKDVQAFAKTTLKSFGIAEGTALDMAALFGDMSTSMGLSTGQAAKLSTSMVGLAGDLASFKNMNIEEVTTALNGVFTGETESLKRLGIVMTEVNLKQFAMEKGIKKNLDQMTQSEKVLLRYQYVMKNTANAQGDFERTGGGAANQMRMFNESLKELGVQFGSVVLPAVTKIIQQFNSILGYLRDLSPAAKTLIVTFAGIAAITGPLLYLAGTVLPKLLTGFQLATKAAALFNTTIGKGSALGILITGLGYVAKSAYDYNKALVETNKLTDDQKKNLDVVKETNEAIKKKIGLLDQEARMLKQPKLPTMSTAVPMTRTAKQIAAERSEQAKLYNENKAIIAQLQSAQAGPTGAGAGGGIDLAGISGAAKGKIGDIVAFKKEIIGLTKDIDEAGKSILALKSEILDIRFDGLKELPSASANLREHFSKYPAYAKEVNMLSSAMDGIKTPFQLMDQKITESTSIVAEQLALQNEQYLLFQQNALIVADAVGNAIGQLGTSIVNSFGLAKSGIEGFLGSLLSAGVQMAAMAIKQSIIDKGKVAGSKAVATGNAIEAGSEAAAATGPAGLLTLAPFIAMAVGAVAAAFSGISAFAKGGIVSGPTMGLMGEYMGAKSNPEVIAPLSKLQNMMDFGGGNDMNLSGEFVVRGQDLILALQRAEKTRNRIG